MNRSLATSALLLTALTAPGLRAQAEVGSDAPEMTSDAWLNFKEFRGTNLSQLRGSALLLEYWATW